MPSPLNPEAKVIALAGDWHANLPVALAQIDRARAAEADLIVQLGDFGYGTPGDEQPSVPGADGTQARSP